MFRRRSSEAKHGATAPDRGQGASPARQGAGPASQSDSPAGDGARQDPGLPPGGSSRPVSPDRPVSPAGEEPGRGAAEPWGPPPVGLDVSAPHPARVWNYWLGGRAFFAAHKAPGGAIGREVPPPAQS